MYIVDNLVCILTGESWAVNHRIMPYPPNKTFSGKPTKENLTIFLAYKMNYMYEAGTTVTDTKGLSQVHNPLDTYIVHTDD